MVQEELISNSGNAETADWCTKADGFYDASGDVERYVGTSDILMMPSIVDVAGINKISKIIFKNAVLTIAGMVAGQEKLAEEETIEEKPLIAASMFGVTTPCVEQAKAVLEQAGYEVSCFHATG